MFEACMRNSDFTAFEQSGLSSNFKVVPGNTGATTINMQSALQLQASQPEARADRRAELEHYATGRSCHAGSQYLFHGCKCDDYNTGKTFCNNVSVSAQALGFLIEIWTLVKCVCPVLLPDTFYFKKSGLPALTPDTCPSSSPHMFPGVASICYLGACDWRGRTNVDDTALLGKGAEFLESITDCVVSWIDNKILVE